MSSNSSLMTRGMIPNCSCCIPELDAVPIVCVLPEPVCPYARMVAGGRNHQRESGTITENECEWKRLQLSTLSHAQSQQPQAEPSLPASLTIISLKEAVHEWRHTRAIHFRLRARLRVEVVVCEAVCTGQLNLLRRRVAHHTLAVLAALDSDEWTNLEKEHRHGRCRWRARSRRNERHTQTTEARQLSKEERIGPNGLPG